MIEAELIGEEQALVQLGADVRAYLSAVRDSVKKVGLRHEAIIKGSKLSGAVLNRRSGRLSAGVHTEFPEDADSFSAVTGIGKDLFYGKMHEEGGIFDVPEHRRTISKAWGKPITPREVLVKAHVMKLPKRSWLRSTLVEQAAADLETIKADVAAAGAKK